MQTKPKSKAADILREIATWVKPENNQDESGKIEEPTAANVIRSIRALLDETLPEILVNCNICLRHTGKYVALVNAKCPVCGVLDSLTQIQEQMQKDEAEAKRKGLVLVRVSARRFIVAKIGTAEGGFWHATQDFGPDTRERCEIEINKVP